MRSQLALRRIGHATKPRNPRSRKRGLGRSVAQESLGTASGGTRGVAAFSRDGVRPFFLGLQFQIPLSDHLSVNSTPDIYHLVEIKDTYHRYVVLISTEERARILGVNLR